MSHYYVYVMTNAHHTLYIGITGDIHKRVYQHKRHLVDGFTARYELDRLVYFEATTDVEAAIAYEKRLKGWVRRRKVELIEGDNPEWQDLAASWFDPEDADPSLRSG